MVTAFRRRRLITEKPVPGVRNWPAPIDGPAELRMVGAIARFQVFVAYHLATLSMMLVAGLELLNK